MDNFWKTPEGKILSYGIHEHSSGLGYIVNAVFFIKLLINNGSIKLEFKDGESEEWFNKSLDGILSGKVKCRESIDYIYEEIKKITKNV